jgi:hypothetical protein
VLLQTLEVPERLAQSCEGGQDQRQRRAPAEEPLWAEPGAAAGSADCAVRAAVRRGIRAAASSVPANKLQQLLQAV